MEFKEVFWFLVSRLCHGVPVEVRDYLYADEVWMYAFWDNDDDWEAQRGWELVTVRCGLDWYI